MNLPPSTYDKHTKIWSTPNVAPLYNIESHSIGSVLFGQMRLHPNKVIQIDDFDGRAITNQEALNWAIRIALHLKGKSMRHNDIVGISARNTTYVTPVALGCFFNGTPFHAVSPVYQEAALSHSFGITKPQIIFCDGSDYEKMFEATKSFKPTIYTLCEDIEGVPSVVDLLEPTKMEYFYQPEKPIRGSDQTVAITSSSGTTGLPKAVTISTHIILFQNRLLNDETIIYSSSGIDWMNGLLSLVVNCQTSCTRIISRKPFSAEYFMELMQKYKITTLLMTPIQLVSLIECPLVTTRNMSSLKAILVGGSHISKQSLEKVQNVTPQCIILYTYGTTESGNISINIGLQRDNSVGKLSPNIKLRIMDDEGQNLGPNEIGEILVQRTYRWAGYYGNPVESQRMLDSLGWFHTGDLGYMDDDGFLYIVDRKKDILKYKALHYWPGEIENAIRELPEVVECCVVGIFDELGGDVAGALVVKAKGSSLTQEQIVNHVKERLVEPEKQLHNGVYFVEQLPYNNNGKVLKREVKEVFKSLMTQK